jgi:hypothetical protein
MGPALSRGAVNRHMLGSIQTHSSMAKVKSSRAKVKSRRAKPQAARARKTTSSRKVAARKDASPRDDRAEWVRKHVTVDQRKLDIVKRAFGLTTDREAIDQALENTVFAHEFSEGMDRLRRSGGLIDMWKGR